MDSRIGRRFPSPAASRRRSPRLLIAFSVVLSGFSMTVCSSTAAPDPATYPGTWFGYLEVGTDRGTFTLEIADDMNGQASGEVSGQLLNWGDYTLTLAGEVTIQPNGHVGGEISATHICTMYDTTLVEGSIWGQFYLESSSAQGSWALDADPPFAATGKWGCQKK